jgi:hypothetical protein
VLFYFANRFLLRFYKQLVQRTNKRDVEKVLLRQESFRRTLLLLVEGVFTEEEPDISTKILDMYHHCPLIFNDYLRLSDYVPDDLDDDLDDLDSDNETVPREFASMGCCRNIGARSFITGKDIQQKFQIPLRLSDLPIMHSFAQLLRNAYEIDYGRPNILNLGTTPTKWCQKLSFSIGYCHPLIVERLELIDP